MMSVDASSRAAATPVRTALEQAAARLEQVSDSPRLDAEVLLALTLDRSRSWLLARLGEPLEDERRLHYQHLIEKRTAGWPIAYLTGCREFWSRRFDVTTDTLIPRPETEHLVEAALARLPADRPARIADLGTGSGIIALTLALERPDCRVTATDIDGAALGVARRNAELHRVGNVDIVQADWFFGFGNANFDLIVSNPPYVADNDPHLTRGDVRYEPPVALSAGPSGLEAIRILIEQSPLHLVPGGWLILEHGHDQADRVAALLAGRRYREIESISDLGGIRRVAVAQWPGRP